MAKNFDEEVYQQTTLDGQKWEDICVTGMFQSTISFKEILIIKYMLLEYFYIKQSASYRAIVVTV